MIHLSSTRTIVIAGLLALASWRASPAQESMARGTPQGLAAENAQLAAEKWLKILDSGDYDLSWKEGAKAFKNGITEAKWKEQATAALGPIGKLSSRKLRSRKYVEDLPNAPKGKYVVLEFDAVFEKKPESVETVFMMLDPDGVWRVSGYFVGPAR